MFNLHPMWLQFQLESFINHKHTADDIKKHFFEKLQNTSSLKKRVYLLLRKMRPVEHEEYNYILLKKLRDDEILQILLFWWEVLPFLYAFAMSWHTLFIGNVKGSNLMK